MRVLAGVLSVCLFAVSNTAEAAVTARVDGGYLYVYGDSSDSTILIESPQPGQIRVIGATAANGSSTVVNGQANGTATFNGWTGGIFCFMYQGSDSVTLTDAVVKGPVHIDLGEGDDQLVIGLLPILQAVQALVGLGPNPLAQNQMQAVQTPDVDIQSTMYVFGAGGADRVTINNSRVHGYATIDLGSEADHLDIGDATSETAQVEFGDGVTLIAGTGDDTATLFNASVARDFVFDDSTGKLSLKVADVVLYQNAFIYGSNVNDTIQLENVLVTSLLKVLSKEGDDSITLNGTDAKWLELFPGLGNDTVVLNNVVADRLNAYLDPGADTITIDASKFTYFALFGSSGNDTFTVRTTRATTGYVYGDGDVDTLIKSGNTISSLNVYSVEHQ